MLETGFDLREDGGHELHTEATFALAERLTGVQLTESILRTSLFQCAVAPTPR